MLHGPARQIRIDKALVCSNNGNRSEGLEVQRPRQDSNLEPSAPEADDRATPGVYLADTPHFSPESPVLSRTHLPDTLLSAC